MMVTFKLLPFIWTNAQIHLPTPWTDWLNLYLTLNAFSFNGQYYRQIGGVAVGCKMGPNYARLFVARATLA